MKKLLNILILFLIVTAAKQAYSQIVPVTQQINIQATVIPHSIVVFKRDLDFGNDLMPGIPKSVSVTSENSGMFEIEGKKNKSIKIKFQLPDELTSGNNSMSIEFSNRDAGYITTGNMKLFDPRKGVNTKLSNTGRLELYIGGTVSPSVTQASGFYSAPIIVNFLYTAD